MKHEQRKTRSVSIRKLIKARLRGIGAVSNHYIKTRHLSPRHLARSVAKANMHREGIRHVNSLFSHYWRNMVLVKRAR